MTAQSVGGARAPLTSKHTDAPRSNGRRALGWTFLLLLLAYGAWVHHGIGPQPSTGAREWYEPRNYIYGSDLLYEWLEPWQLGVASLTAPAILLAIGVFAGTRSGVARALAIGTVASVALFAFYGIYATRIWEFFGWRGSLTLIGIGMAIGGTAAAPALAESWLRRSWALRIAFYVPIFFGIVALLRNATGTNEALRFNFSPWPGIPIFGLEMASYTIVGVLLGAALGAAALSMHPSRPRLALVGVAGAVCLPAIWFYGRFSGTPSIAILALIAVGVIAVGATAIARRADRERVLLRRAGLIAVGAALAWLPLLSGRALATGDYTTTRFVLAQQVIDALQRYYDEQDVYPDELHDLVRAEYITEIPRPRIGFELLYDLGWIDSIEFSYRSLGNSYVLEFEAPEWVQCAYNPPWDDYEDEELEEDYVDEYADESGEAWSCPDTRPELW